MTHIGTPPMIKGRLSEYTERDFKKLIETIRSCEARKVFKLN